ncbi:MAG: hypothetical protein WD028_09490 [Balneolaceae bacterium]
MLEITGNYIKELNDSDLRSLIGLLCEAELREQGIPTAGVKWGGDQRAADGGIDVKVEIKSTLHQDGYIPKPITGFQVKEPDMFPGEIDKEMRPNGELRESIKQLAEVNGAYIIVSSNSSTSETALTNRKKAMIEALSDLESPENLKTDFYDSVRIASWVRSHPSLILWVRQKIGKPFQGWQPYANWANAPGGIEEEYLLDDEIRLFDGASARDFGLKGVEAINMLRQKLSHPKSSIRLTGLSGVGKTRLVQALFDERIGDHPLNPTQVFYTDIGNSPVPSPQNFAEQIIAIKTSAIIVIDNCSPDLHKQVNDVCTAPKSLVSLITVEYDVRDDQPEETDIYHLEPASLDLIEKMVRTRYKHVSQVDARTISEFSGGNARIAIALAETVEKGETLAELKDQELFKRLFYQRNDPDNQLMKSAEVCSLVYSFDIRTDEGSNQEMKLLSELAGKSVMDLYRDIAELKCRQLIQQRNHWRAVLPHAIANRLAKHALENIPINVILKTLNIGGERLFISFSRRLGYLHESEKAGEIAEKWLSKDDLLGDISNLNRHGIDLLKNVAPIRPEATLKAIERAANSEQGKDFTSRDNKNYVDISHLLTSLAYDPELFDRSVDLLIRFTLSEDKDENVNSIRNQIKSLFQLYLSGSLATTVQRLKVIRKLISSKSEYENQLGFELLRSALQSSHFTSYQQFDFGARPRNTGFWPKIREDFLAWFQPYLSYTVELATSNQSVAEKAKVILAENFQGLWTNVKLYDELEEAANRIIESGTWKEGWVGVRKTIRYRKKELNPKALDRLNTLEEKLKPTSLIDKAKLYALSKHGTILELPDTINEEEIKSESDRYRLIGEAAKSVGKEVAQNQEVLSLLLSDLIQVNGAWSFQFGKGLAEGIHDVEKLWNDFKSQLKSIDENKRYSEVLRGFLYQLHEKDPEKFNALLDDAVSDDVLSPVFPQLQTIVKLDKRGLERLHQSLELEAAQIYMYNSLAYGRTHERIGDEELSDLLNKISEKPDGLPVAIDIMQMRFHGIKDEEEKPSDEFVQVGREFLNRIKFDRNNNGIRSEDYTLSEIIEICFKGEGAEEAASEFCNRLAVAISEYHVFAEDYTSVYEALIKEQPIVFLNCFYGENNEFRPTRLTWDTEFRKDPLTKLKDDIIIEWCEENPTERYPIIASVITPFHKSKEANHYEWTSLAKYIINNSPNTEMVLDNFYRSLYPNSWSGSLASTLQTQMPLIADLKDHENPAVADWAFNAEMMFEKEIQLERQREAEREQAYKDEYGFE